MRLLLAAAILAPLMPSVAFAADPASCRTVRFSDIGWTDVTVTTALTSYVLESIGYKPKIIVLSVPVTYASMKNKDIDVFLGNWMPSQESDQKPFVDSKAVDVVGPNLEGAKYTLAVPAYTYDAGVHDFADIHKIADQLGDKIYGIEPGNDGNGHVLSLIKADRFDLGKFKLVESSEQGMLAEVDRKVRAKEPIVFLGWEPHPMNAEFPMKYLTGGDDTFGPNYGGATVYTNVRAGYTAACPNVGKLLTNMKFTLPEEDAMMGDVLIKKEDPGKAVAAYLKAHPDLLTPWLAGVTTFDGQPALPAMQAKLAG